MELTLATFRAFLKPFFEAYEIDENNVVSVTVEPEGVEVVEFVLDKKGNKILLGDSLRKQSTYYPYLAAE